MKLSDLTQDKDANQQKKKTIVVYAILATLVVLVLLIVALCITSIVYKGKSNNEDLSTDTSAEKEISSDGIPSGYVETTFDAAQLYSGSLIMVNETYPVNAASANTYILLQNYAERPKTPAGSNTYTVDDKTKAHKFKSTPEAAEAFNKMLGDYYVQNHDDNLILSGAYYEGVETGSIYASGMTFELKYFVNYAKDSSLRAGIYGVQTYDWIYENAYKYGFINLASASADGSEPENANVFRYVGEAHAAAMKHKKISTLEGYLDYLKTETSVSKPLSVSTENGKLKIYYCAADATAYVSEKNVWEASGNNADGYIITVNTSVKAESTDTSAQT